MSAIQCISRPDFLFVGFLDSCVIRYGKSAILNSEALLIPFQVMLYFVARSGPRCPMAPEVLLKLKSVFSVFEAAAGYGGRVALLMVCESDNAHYKVLKLHPASSSARL